MPASWRFNAALSGFARITGSALGSSAQFRAVTADGGKLQRRKNQIDVMKRAAGDQRQGAAGQGVEPRQRLPQPGRHPDLLRRRREIENRAVDIEQNRAFAQIGNERRVRKLHVEIRDFQTRLPKVHLRKAHRCPGPISVSQSTNASGRATVSSGLRSAATPHSASTAAAPIIKAAPMT